jgi:thiamine pyrophosphokinase
LVNRSARGYLYDSDTVVTAFKGEIRLAARRRGVVSLYALGESVEGVWLRVLKYELTNARLSCDFPIGVSNAFTGLPVQIKVKHGILLAVYPAGTRELDSSPVN